MKILIDECIDRKLAKALSDHEVKTVPQMGWAGIKNGQLLSLAATEFDTFITVDRNLPFQQNLAQFEMAIVVLAAPSNRLADLQPLVPQILKSLPTLVKGTAIVISAN